MFGYPFLQNFEGIGITHNTILDLEYVIPADFEFHFRTVGLLISPGFFDFFFDEGTSPPSVIDGQIG